MLLARLILRTLFGMAGLWLAEKVVPGIDVRDATSLLIAALLMGIINAVVRPVLFFLTLPLTVLTLGLFLLVLNAGMLSLTAWLMKGFTVAGFWPAIFGAVIIGIVSWVSQMLIEPRTETRE